MTYRQAYRIIIATPIVIAACGCSNHELRKTIYEQEVRAVELITAGNKLSDEGKYDEAITEYEEALRIRPDWDIALDNIRIARERKTHPYGVPDPDGPNLEKALNELNNGQYSDARKAASLIQNPSTQKAYLDKIAQAEHSRSTNAAALARP